MFLIQLLTSIVMASSVSWAEPPVADTFQNDIDSAFQEIMQTHTGKAICQLILGADADAIAFHLGVSSGAATTIAQGCVGELANDWIYATVRQEISSLPTKFTHGRTYRLMSANTSFPIESWTDPISNTTVILAGRDGISHERLVQLMAHEMAVYFDSKANPASTDAKAIPDLRDLRFVDGTATGPMQPLVAISDPLVAHTMTFIRALQVEYSIVDELIDAHKIVAPKDHDDPNLKALISDQCQEQCLEKAVVNIRQQAYLPISLPLLAFAPYFRSLLNRDLTALESAWNSEQKVRANASLNDLPNRFLQTQFTGDPLLDLQRVFIGLNSAVTEFQVVVRFVSQDLWPLEWPSLTRTQVLNGGEPQSLLEYMKKPLMSTYNISLSSGPRVRIRTGSLE